MNISYLKTLSLFAALLVGGSTLAHAGASLGTPAGNPLDGYTSFTQSYDIPYAGTGPGFGNLSPIAPTVNITVQGMTHAVTLDTGSRGLYESENMLPANYTPVGIAGNLYLSSSKRLFVGTWATQSISFPDSTTHGGTTGLAQSTIPVLIVQSLTALGGNATYDTVPSTGFITLTDNTTVPIVNKTVTLTPNQTATYAQNAGKFGTASNFGVGIDPSGTSTNPNNTDQYNQQYNGFLNIDQMKAGTMVAGYTLDHTGVHVGLTTLTTGYAYTNLIPSGLAQVPGSPRDWQVPTGTINYNGTLSQTGRILVDTGIDYAFLTLPDGHGGNATDNYTVNFLNSNGAVSFEVNTSANNTLVPAYTQWSDFSPGLFSESQSPYGEQFLNTGRDPINGFDLVYDAQDGFYGMKPNDSVPDANINFTAAFYNSPVPVPEPATIVLPALCGVLLLGRRFRRSVSSRS